MQSHPTCHFGAERKSSFKKTQNETILEKILYIEFLHKSLKGKGFWGGGFAKLVGSLE